MRQLLQQVTRMHGKTAKGALNTLITARLAGHSCGRMLVPRKNSRCFFAQTHQSELIRLKEDVRRGLSRFFLIRRGVFVHVCTFT